MKIFSSGQIAELNKHEGGAIHFEGLAVSRDSAGSVKDYFAKIDQPFTLDGNEYQPLDLAFEGFETGNAMQVPVFRIVLSNLFDQVIEYMEDQQINLRGNPVTIQVLHMDALGQVTLYDSYDFTALFLVSDYQAATLHVGIVWPLKRREPEDTMELDRYPAMKANVVRAGT